MTMPSGVALVRNDEVLEVPVWFDDGRLDANDVGLWRAVPEPVQETVDRIVVSLGEQLHPPVVPIPDPPEKLQLTGFASGRLPEEDSLDPPRDEHVHGDHPPTPFSGWQTGQKWDDRCATTTRSIGVPHRVHA